MLYRAPSAFQRIFTKNYNMVIYYIVEQNKIPRGFGMYSFCGTWISYIAAIAVVVAGAHWLVLDLAESHDTAQPVSQLSDVGAPCAGSYSAKRTAEPAYIRDFYTALKAGSCSKKQLSDYVYERLQSRIAVDLALSDADRPLYCKGRRSVNPRTIVKSVAWGSHDEGVYGLFDMCSKRLTIDMQDNDPWFILFVIEHELTHAFQVSNLESYCAFSKGEPRKKIAYEKLPKVVFNGCKFPCAIPHEFACDLARAERYVRHAEDSSTYFDRCTERDADKQACCSVPYPKQGLRFFSKRVKEWGDADMGPYLRDRECISVLTQRVV